MVGSFVTMNLNKIFNLAPQKESAHNINKAVSVKQEEVLKAEKRLKNSTELN